MGNLRFGFEDDYDLEPKRYRPRDLVACCFRDQRCVLISLVQIRV